MTSDTSIPTLEEVDAYEAPWFLAKRVAEEHGYELDVAEGLVREAKRMLYLCIVSKESIAPSDRVDAAWHEMLMFTRWYRDFSNFIGGYVHHEPTPPPKSEATAIVHKQKPLTVDLSLKPSKEAPPYTKTKENYEKFFEMKPDPLYWP